MRKMLGGKKGDALVADCQVEFECVMQEEAEVSRRVFRDIVWLFFVRFEVLLQNHFKIAKT